MTTDQTLPLIIRLFGPFQLLRGGRSLPPPRSRKGHELLALLTLRHGQEVSRTWLAYTLWPDSPHEAALASLGQSLHNLRKVLGEEASRIGTPSSRSLCLDVTDADVDVIAFDRAIAHGSPEALQEAITHYRGPFLEGCLEPWADAERAYREQAYLQALDRLATRARYDGALDVTIGYLKRILSTDPFHLAANRQLMQMYTNAEDYATALQIFYDLRQRLHEEHKILPDDETTALYQRIVALARQRSESSSQTAGPLSQALAPVIGLPEPLTDLIGRDQEVSEIAADLLSVRLITLSGIGGVGKTRLAIQVARESASHFMHGVGFVRLEALTDAAHLSQQIATVLKVPAERGRSWEEALQDYLSSRQLLLVLDNCEHLRDSCAPISRKVAGRVSRIAHSGYQPGKIGVDRREYPARFIARFTRFCRNVRFGRTAVLPVGSPVSGTCFRQMQRLRFNRRKCCRHC